MYLFFGFSLYSHVLNVLNLRLSQNLQNGSPTLPVRNSFHYPDFTEILKELTFLKSFVVFHCM